MRGVNQKVNDMAVSGANMAEDITRLNAFCIQVAEENRKLKRMMSKMWSKVQQLVHIENFNRDTRMYWTENSVQVDGLPEMEVTEWYDEEEDARNHQD